MKPFTKLFSSITSSSIWRAPNHVRIVWITMLAMADRDGEIWASVGGLADLARVSCEDCAAALVVLSSPDSDSRTKDHEGRRIETIDGGWLILNYKKYRELGRNEDRREYFAKHKRQQREAKKQCPQMSTLSTIRPQMSPIAEAEAEAEAEKTIHNNRKSRAKSPEQLCVARHAFRIKGSRGDKTAAIRSVIAEIGVAETDRRLESISGIWASDLYGAIGLDNNTHGFDRDGKPDADAIQAAKEMEARIKRGEPA